MLPLLLTLAALAQDASTIDPPAPAAATPWPTAIAAYALPPQKIEYLTDEAPERHCDVVVTLQPDGSFEAKAAECPEPMKADAVAATEQWRFEGGGEGPTSLTVRYVLVYSATVATTTLHAEVDPGAEASFEQGPPGLKLVHPAALERPVKTKLPKAARKAGVDSGQCTVHVKVAHTGKVTAAEPQACPAELAEDARKRALKSRWSPRTVDGLTEDALVGLTLEYGQGG